MYMYSLSTLNGKCNGNTAQNLEFTWTLNFIKHVISYNSEIYMDLRNI